MKFDIKILEKYEKDNWIYSHKHKTLPLIIWNYSQFTQYESKWDEITLSCRGLVTDLEGHVVSKGFDKFFNYSEGRTKLPENIKNVKVYNKLDGSYIGVFYYNGEWVVNSKGSFYSDQVVWAKEVIKNQSILDALDKSYTYCFELIYPENRIVVDYKGVKTLSLLAVFDKQGVESESELDRIDKGWNVSLPGLQIFSNFDPERLKNFNHENQEGFVVKFENGERCKIKFEEYVRLHAIVTNTSSYDIWRCLMNNDSMQEILDNIPDEFYDFVRQVKYKLLKDFHQVKSEIFEQYLYYLKIKSDKEFALKVKDNEYKPQLFALRSNKNIDNWVWNHVKPEYKKPFE